MILIYLSQNAVFVTVLTRLKGFWISTLMLNRRVLDSVKGKFPQLFKRIVSAFTGMLGSFRFVYLFIEIPK